MPLIPYRNLGRFCRKAVLQPGYAWRVFLKRSQALFRHALGTASAGTPEAITLFLTYRCNLRCQMCGQWGERGVTRQHAVDGVHQEPEYTLLERLVSELSASRPSFTLFGGEPLLHPGCLRLIRLIKSRGMHCVMITNGTLLESVARELAESGLDELNVSVDGDAELHDSIRGPGVFERVARGLGRLQEAKKAMGTARPLVNIQCTVNSRNHDRLEELVKVCRRLRADSLTFHNLIFLEEERIAGQKKIDELLGCPSRGWEGFVFKPGVDSRLVYRTVSGIRSGRYPFSVDLYPNFRPRQMDAYYNDPAFVPSDYPRRCLSPWLVAYVFPDGSVRPCLNSEYSFGNVKDGVFSGIWNSEAAKKFRKLLREHGIFPACVRCTELYRY